MGQATMIVALLGLCISYRMSNLNLDQSCLGRQIATSSTVSHRWQQQHGSTLS